jgi:hypothetical protein
MPLYVRRTLSFMHHRSGAANRNVNHISARASQRKYVRSHPPFIPTHSLGLLLEHVQVHKCRNTILVQVQVQSHPKLANRKIIDSMLDSSGTSLSQTNRIHSLDSLWVIFQIP